MTPAMKLMFAARSLVFPGIDLHTRSRRSLSKFWGKGPRTVLDAGSGNGYFSWLAYKTGATVLALNFEKSQVEKSNAFFLDFKKCDPARLSFEERNLYTLESLVAEFDEIICFETLEHIKEDSRVCSQFFRLLKPGGVLHLCCPNALHPRHVVEQLDHNETGGHVRSGYTGESYRMLLEPIGFRIERIVGLGTPRLFKADRALRMLNQKFGLLPSVLAFPFAALALLGDQMTPAVPFSLYVKAIKPVR
jgi:SAM-dependent methyltransferase